MNVLGILAAKSTLSFFVSKHTHTQYSNLPKILAASAYFSAMLFFYYFLLYKSLVNFIQKCERNEQDKKMPVDAQSFEEHSRSVSCYVLASIFFFFCVAPKLGTCRRANTQFFIIKCWVLCSFLLLFCCCCWMELRNWNQCYNYFTFIVSF